MKKVSMFLVCSTISTFAHGFSFPGSEQFEKMVSEKKSSSPESFQPTTECANFSGSWVGTCHYESNGKVQEEKSSATIKQKECRSLWFGTERPLAFGGQITKTDFSDSSLWAETFTLDWLISKQVAFMTMDFNIRSTSSFNLFKANGNVKFEMLGNQLVTETQIAWRNLSTTDKIGNGSQKCVYDRATK